MINCLLQGELHWRVGGQCVAHGSVASFLLSLARGMTRTASLRHTPFRRVRQIFAIRHDQQSRTGARQQILARYDIQSSISRIF
jgi:hypothetical protein